MATRRLTGLTAVHVLLLVALLEVAINRVAVPLLRPVSESPPSWHTYLDYTGLFLFYFAGTLAALLLAVHCWKVIFEQSGRARATAVLVLITTVLAALPLIIDAPVLLSVTLEVAFAASVMTIVVTSFGAGRDLGLQIGLPIVAVPLVMHTANALGTRFVWSENIFDGPGVALAQAGVVALCFAALASPYCFAPRPFARAVLRARPLLVALVVAVAGVLLARSGYAVLSRAATLAVGVELSRAQPDPRLAMYLLAVATLAWTLTSCATAAIPARRCVGVGLALIVLGGYGFKWPHHYLLPLFGLMLIGDAARTVREDELAALPIASQTPPIADAAWSAYITLVTQGLRRVFQEVHSLTTRGDGGLTSSVIVGEARGIAVRLRIERIEGAVLGLDVVLGREIDEVRGATLTAWAIPPRALGINPSGPPAAPIFRTDDPQFDERFKTRGSAIAFRQLFDDGLRARATATLDGWLAYWEGEGLRYRVYPGRGAPLDHPMPLSDLALGRGSVNAERLISVIELLLEVALRGIPARLAGDTSPEPEELA